MDDGHHRASPVCEGPRHLTCRLGFAALPWQNRRALPRAWTYRVERFVGQTERERITARAAGESWPNPRIDPMMQLGIRERSGDCSPFHSRFGKRVDLWLLSGNACPRWRRWGCCPAHTAIPAKGHFPREPAFIGPPFGGRRCCPIAGRYLLPLGSGGRPTNDELPSP